MKRKLIVCCRDHKKYLGKYAPRTDCFACHLIYIIRLRGNKRPDPDQYKLLSDPIKKAFEQAADGLEIFEYIRINCY